MIRLPKKIVPNLWFDNEGEEAANFYVSIFNHSRIVGKSYYTEAGPGPAGGVLTVDFELEGQPFTALNGGRTHFEFNHAISMLVNCETQQEIDYYWDKLSEGGATVECGWLKDKFGVSWQIVPVVLGELMQDPDPVKKTNMMRALFRMKKLDIEELLIAFEGEQSS